MVASPCRTGPLRPAAPEAAAVVAGPRVPRHSIGTAGTAIPAAAADPHLLAAVHTVAMPPAAVPVTAAAGRHAPPPPLLLQTRHSHRLMSTPCGGRGTAAAAAAARGGTRRDSRQRHPRWRWGGHSTVVVSVVVSEHVVVAGVAAAGVPLMAVAVTAADAMTAQLAWQRTPLSDLQPHIQCMEHGVRYMLTRGLALRAASEAVSPTSPFMRLTGAHHYFPGKDEQEEKPKEGSGHNEGKP